MTFFYLFISYCFLIFAVSVQCAELSFQSMGNGFYSFDTGALKGQLRADDPSQGIPTLIDKETGLELAYGKNNPGILSYYRIFTSNHRFGDSARAWPKTSKRLPDGGVEITWPPREEHPFEMTAIYRWKSPTTLDLETIVKAETNLPKFEVFLSSYFNSNFKTYMYVKPTLHTNKEPYFMPVTVNPFTIDTYLAFPRDREACQMIFDGRWEHGPHPVHFSVGKFYEYPFCIKRDEKNGIDILLMSRPQDCFAVEMPYDMTPPDGIAGHNSVYFSLFGNNIRENEIAHASYRLIIERKMTEDRSMNYFQQFVQDTKRIK